MVFLRTALNLQNGIIGAVLNIQTFGDDGRVHRNLLRNLPGVMYTVHGTSKFIPMIMKWRHNSGFSVDNSVRISRDDNTGITNLAQYIIRSPFSTAKLNYNNDTGMVIYHSGMTFGKNKKNFSISSAEEFIAAITQHIPEKNFQLVRYSGWYSNRMRGDRNKQELEDRESEGTDNEIEIIDISNYKPRKIPPPTWRECIKKIWEVDPLKCPHCKGEMKIISFINERPVIRKILEHLNLWDV